MAADLRAQLLAAFAIEFRDHLAVIRRELSGIARTGSGNLKDAFRRAHSLKGAARAVDLPAVEEIAHRLEAVFDGLLNGSLAPERRTVTALEAGLDILEASATAGLQGGAMPDAGEVLAGLQAVLDRTAGEEEPPQAPPPHDDAAQDERETRSAFIEPAPTVEAAPDAEAVSPISAPAPEGSVEFVRVAAGDVDALWRTMHRLSSDLQSSRLMDDLAAIQGALAGLRGEIRAAASHLGAGRSAGRTAAPQNLDALARRLQTLTGHHRAALDQMERTAGQMRRGLERLSLVPVDSVFAGSGRMLRDLARAEGRDVDIQVTGLDLQADRRVLQALSDPVMHALRNTLSHAAESPEERAARHKPAQLGVTLAFSAEGGRLVVRVSDDGRGPDLARIEALGAERGLLPRRMPGTPPPPAEDLLSLVFEPGFSTREAADHLSGRGMGLSVVAETAAELGGSARLLARRPHGTELVVEVPLASQRQSLVMVEAGGECYAVPAHAIGGVMRELASGIEVLAGMPALRIQIRGRDVTVPIVSLAVLVDHGEARLPQEAGYVKAILLSRGERWCALAVDTVRDADLYTVTDLPDLGTETPVTGAVLLGERLVPVLNAEALVERWMRGEWRLAAAAATPPQPERAARATTILVVDDSVTTRTLEKSILETQGYRVLLSVDGLDALTRLRSGEDLVDLVITDVEMPRMDGFGLLQALRADPNFARLPVVMMTSRAAPEDVRRGLDLGAQAYVTKQAFDQGELLATIGRLL